LSSAIGNRVRNRRSLGSRPAKPGGDGLNGGGFDATIGIMALKDPSFTIGIEEEYLLVDHASRDLVGDMPQALFDAAQVALQERVAREFLKSQIEVGTSVHRTPREAGQELADLRATMARLAGEHGLAPIAASTHPFARWSAQQPTERDRYQAIAHDLAGVGRRLVICGMHVHVGIEDDELRIDLMNQARYFLPHLLVLSTSSPFAEGEDTGLKCYRLAAYQELPRTGLPGRFESWEEYRHTVDLLVRNSIIEDASKIWWDMRPSSRFPTLEMRITDVCTRLEDAVCVAAMYVSVLRMLYRIRRNNQTWRTYPLFLLSENRWRAQRYGVGGTLFDFGKGELVPFRDLVDELIALLGEDAEALGCLADIEHARTIVTRGTSADRQVACFEQHLAQGAPRPDALAAVVDHLIAETVAGV
jgi:carboxylate-amine ligase